jgi:hypothetical protein
MPRLWERDKALFELIREVPFFLDSLERSGDISQWAAEIASIRDKIKIIHDYETSTVPSPKT